MATVGFDGIDLSDMSSVAKGKPSVRMMLSDLVLTMSSRLQDDEIVLDNASTINLMGNSSLLSEKFRNVSP